MTPRVPRILIYSHDTYGLGHLRRNLLIAGRIASSGGPPPATLIATGSARSHAFSFPLGCDVIKLPSVVKGSDGHYRPRSVGLSLSETIAIRSHLLVETARSFRPDIILVDHAPAGVEGELLPLFKELRNFAHRPKVVLGLREVIDEAGRVEDEWERLGAFELLESTYDRILVYGDRRVLTTADELHLDTRFPGKLAWTGYLGRQLRRPIRMRAEGELPLVLVTTGGGGDGQELLRAYVNFLEALPEPPRWRSVIITGPFLSPRRRLELLQRFRTQRHPVEIHAFTDRMEELLSQASAIVCMAGYNSAIEAVAADVPTLFIPREAPRLEQFIRAERLVPHADVSVCRAEDATPARILAFIQEAVHRTTPRLASLDLGGLDRLAREMDALLVQISHEPAAKPRELAGGAARARALP